MLVLVPREMVEGRQRGRKGEEMGGGVLPSTQKSATPATSVVPSLSSTRAPLEGKLSFFPNTNLLLSFDYLEVILVTSPSKIVTQMMSFQLKMKRLGL